MKGINHEILRLALPSILANITVPLVGMVDIAVAGHLDGGAAAFIGAISVGSMLFDLLYWNFYFLRAGTGGLTAQAYGRGDISGCARLLVRGMAVALALSLAVLLIQLPFVSAGLYLTDASPQVKELARRYFLLRVWAAPATVSLMALRGWFVGMQDTVSSMFADLVVNVVNIVASIVLTLGIGRWRGIGFTGIAAGTVLAQYCGLLYALGRTALRYGHLFRGMGREDLRSAFARSELKEFFALNGDLLLRSLSMTAIYIGFTAISAHYGDATLAAGAILMKLLMLFSFFTDGFAYAAEALCGRFIGAGDLAGTRSAVRGVFRWSMGIAALFMVVYWVLGMPLLRLMSSDPEVVETAARYLPWLLLMPPVGCAAFTWDGVYEGATATRPLRDATICAAVGFFGAWLLLRWTVVAPAAASAVTGASSAAALGASSAIALHCLLGAYFVHLAVRTLWLGATYRRHILTPGRSTSKP